MKCVSFALLLNISALARYIPAGIISLYYKAAVFGAMINEMPFTALNRKFWETLKQAMLFQIMGDHGTGSGSIYIYIYIYIYIQSALCNSLTSKKEVNILQVTRRII